MEIHVITADTFGFAREELKGVPPTRHPLELRFGARSELGLPGLISIKEEMGGDRDKAVLPILRRTLEEKSRGERGSPTQQVGGLELAYTSRVLMLISEVSVR